MCIWPILILVLVNFSQGQIFIDYSDLAGQGQMLFRFFHDVEDGYYVDLGAYDPFYHSNTLNLGVMGWQGINIDAGPDRLTRFFFTRPWENSLNAAAGIQNQFTLLYDFSDDSTSTVSPKVKDYVQGFNRITKEQYVPSLSLKQVCQRYYTRRPLFMNLDIQGFGYKALQSNDWNNPKCVPDIIFSQINTQTIKSGFPIPEVVLLKNGYKKWLQDARGSNEVYIHQTVFDLYSKKYNQVGESFKKLIIKRFGSNFQQEYNIGTNLWLHYEVKTDQIYFHIIKNKEIVDIQLVWQYSNFISDSRKNRPIILMNYNPDKNYIAIRKDYKYAISQAPQLKNAFFKISISKNSGQTFVFYIYKHGYSLNPKFLVLDQYKGPQKKLTSNILKASQQQLSKETEMLLNSSMSQSINSLSTKTKITENAQNKFGSLEQNIYKALYPLQLRQNRAKKTQIVSLAVTFICLVIINVSICFSNLSSLRRLQNEQKKEDLELYSSDNIEKQQN